MRESKPVGAWTEGDRVIVLYDDGSRYWTAFANGTSWAQYPVKLPPLPRPGGRQPDEKQDAE